MSEREHAEDHAADAALDLAYLNRAVRILNAAQGALVIVGTELADLPEGYIYADRLKLLAHSIRRRVERLRLERDSMRPPASDNGTTSEGK